MRIALASLLLISTLAIPAPAMAMSSPTAAQPTSSATMAFAFCEMFPALPWCRG